MNSNKTINAGNHPQKVKLNEVIVTQPWPLPLQRSSTPSRSSSVPVQKIVLAGYFTMHNKQLSKHGANKSGDTKLVEILIFKRLAGGGSCGLEPGQGYSKEEAVMRTIQHGRWH